MSFEYIVVNKQELEAQIRQAVEAAVSSALHRVTENALTLKLPTPQSSGDRPTVVNTPEAASVGIPRGKYRIGTAAEESSYADVVYREMPKSVFSQEDACEIIEEFVVDLTERYKDSMRRSINNDDRFVRLDDRQGFWWARRDARQLEIE